MANPPRPEASPRVARLLDETGDWPPMISQLATAPPEPSRAEMPEIQVGDVIAREVVDSARRVDGLGWAYLHDGAVWIGRGDASITRVERNGVVLWRKEP